MNLIHSHFYPHTKLIPKRIPSQLIYSHIFLLFRRQVTFACVKRIIGLKDLKGFCLGAKPKAHQQVHQKDVQYDWHSAMSNLRERCLIMMLKLGLLPSPITVTKNRSIIEDTDTSDSNIAQMTSKKSKKMHYVCFQTNQYLNDH